jgi:FAD synthetase
MSLEALVTKYIVSAEKVLDEIQRTKGSVTLNKAKIDEILGYVTAYLKDAKYYKDEKKFETSLTSIAYCEGLLDALRLLGVVTFQWPIKTEREK